MCITVSGYIYQVVRNMKKFCCFFFNCSYVIIPVLIIESFAWIIAQIIACSARKISWNFHKSASRASRRCGFLTSFSKLNMLFSRTKSGFLFCSVVNSFKLQYFHNPSIKGEMYDERKYPLDKSWTYFLGEFTFIFPPLAI